MVKRKRVTRKRVQIVPKECFFCKGKNNPSYIEVSDLQKFVSDRGKILGRVRTGVCAKHQRKLTIAIKHARHLALLPFVGRW
jgi:small subunit ribosomal protein S18